MRSIRHCNFAITHFDVILIKERASFETRIAHKVFEKVSEYEIIHKKNAKFLWKNKIPRSNSRQKLTTAIRNIPLTTNVIKQQGFLGLLNYYLAWISMIH